MAGFIRTTPDRFAADMTGILSEFVGKVDRETPEAVRAACKVARKRAKAGAPSKHKDGYKSGFSYKVRTVNGRAVGYVGNRLKPGLVHLLEKGHATPAGGRVEGRPHMAPAADEAFEVFEREVGAAIDRALR